MNQMQKLSSLAVLSIIFILFVYVIGGITTVDPGEVVIKIKMIGSDKGMVEDPLEIGMHWVDPITYDVVNYDTRRKQYIDSLEEMPSQTKDGQPVTVDLSLEIGLVGDKVPFLHETVGKDWYNRIVFPAVRSAVRNMVPSQSSDEVYTETGRMIIQNKMQDHFNKKFLDVGIDVAVNLKAINFTNPDFVQVLERKAIAQQNVEIENRNAQAAEKVAIKTANLAEGEKQRVIKESEAEREKARLAGEGMRLQKEEEAKGILAVATAEAEGIRLRNQAYSGEGGDRLVSIAWAENLGPNVKVMGIPTGAPGTTSLMDLNGILSGAFKGIETVSAK